MKDQELIDALCKELELRLTCKKTCYCKSRALLRHARKVPVAHPLQNSKMTANYLTLSGGFWKNIFS